MWARSVISTTCFTVLSLSHTPSTIGSRLRSTKSDLILGMVGDVGDMLGRQPRVDGVQHRADAGDAEIELEMAVGVPGDGADPVAELDAQPLQRLGELLGALGRVPIAVAVDRPLDGARDDLDLGIVGGGEVDDLRNQQRTVLHQPKHGVSLFYACRSICRLLRLASGLRSGSRPSPCPPGSDTHPSVTAKRSPSSPSRSGLGLASTSSRPGPRTARQQVQRMHQPDGAAQEVRAIGAAGCQRRPCHRQTARMAAPFGGVGLDDPQEARIDGFLEGASTAQILAAGKPGRGDGGDLRPFGPRPVSRQRFLDPVQPELGELRRHAAGRRQVPALVDVDHQPLAGLESLRHRPQRAEIGLLAEADLDLVGAVARRTRALDRIVGGAAGIEARGIDRHGGIVGPAQRAPQRQAALACAQVMDRKVEARGGGRERAGIAALDAQHVQCPGRFQPIAPPDRRAACRARAAPRCRRTAARGARRWRSGSSTRSRPSRARRRSPRP